MIGIGTGEIIVILLVLAMYFGRGVTLPTRFSLRTLLVVATTVAVWLCLVVMLLSGN
jgi:hypothetical protein